ncbi:MAG: hypothetical protein ACLQAR_04215 [Steroidobacteraceae bacterium]
MMNRRVLAWCAVALLAACHRDSSPAPQPMPAPRKLAPAAKVAGAKTPQQLTADMVEAASQGKSQAPVMLKFDLLQRPTVGQPLQVVLALLPQIPGELADIDVAGSDSLQVAAGDGRVEIAAVDPAQVYRHQITVTPTAEGMQFLSLKVSLKHDEMTESREFAVPLIVAAAPAAAANQKP